MTTLIANKTTIRFQKDAAIRTEWRKPLSEATLHSTAQSMAHSACFNYLESQSIECFLFEIDKTKAPAACRKIINKIEAMGFTIEDAPMEGVIGNQRKYAFR